MLYNLTCSRRQTIKRTTTAWLKTLRPKKGSVYLCLIIWCDGIMYVCQHHKLKVTMWCQFSWPRPVLQVGKWPRESFDTTGKYIYVIGIFILSVKEFHGSCNCVLLGCKKRRREARWLRHTGTRRWHYQKFRKVYRDFRDELSEKQAFILPATSSTRLVCIICKESVAIVKSGNIKHHYQSRRRKLT